MTTWTEIPIADIRPGDRVLARTYKFPAGRELARIKRIEKEDVWVIGAMNRESIVDKRDILKAERKS